MLNSDNIRTLLSGITVLYYGVLFVAQIQTEYISPGEYCALWLHLITVC